MFNNVKTRKYFIIFLIIALIVGGVAWYQYTAWEREMTIIFVEYVSDDISGDYRLYEITNNTNKPLRGINAIIEISSLRNSSVKLWKFEGYVGYRLDAGQTMSYKLFKYKIEESAEKEGVKLGLYSVKIKRVTYEKDRYI